MERWRALYVLLLGMKSASSFFIIIVWFPIHCPMHICCVESQIVKWNDKHVLWNFCIYMVMAHTLSPVLNLLLMAFQKKKWFSCMHREETKSTAWSRRFGFFHRRMMHAFMPLYLTFWLLPGVKLYTWVMIYFFYRRLHFPYIIYFNLQILAHWFM
jgi:hypothetical protein